MGSISLCTPSLDTSAPLARERPHILSISSMKTMPCSSARLTASCFTLSSSISLSDSSSIRILRASFTFMRRILVRFGIMPPIISPTLIDVPPSSSWGALSSTSTDIYVSSSSPSISCCLISSLLPLNFCFSSGDISGSLVCLPIIISIGLGTFLGSGLSITFTSLSSAITSARVLTLVLYSFLTSR